MSRIKKLKDSRVKAREALKAVTDELDPILTERALTSEEEKRFEDARKHVADLDAAYETARAERIQAKEEEEERAAKLGGVQVDSGVVRIGKEPLTYGPESPDNSFYRDLFHANLPASRAFDTARKRLIRHQTEMDGIRRAAPASKEGRALRRYDLEVRRLIASSEYRDVSTESGSMGDFAPPLYFLTDYGPYRTYGRTLIDQVKPYPLPETGMTFNVPRVTTPTEAENQTTTTQGAGENTTVSTRTMVSDYQNGTLQTIIDNLKVSQQYLDRVGPGIGGDQIVRDDQQRQVNRTLNVFAWKTLMKTATVGHVTYAGVTKTDVVSFTAATFLQATAKAKAIISKTDGVVAYPTHFLTDVDVWGTLEGAHDTTNRPLCVPQGVAFNPLLTGNDAAVPEGYSGFHFAGLPAFKDQANWVAWETVETATDTKKDQHVSLVAALDIAGYWLEGTPVIRVLPQPYAKSLTVLIQEYVYCALVLVYPEALQLVFGAGTKTTLLTA